MKQLRKGEAEIFVAVFFWDQVWQRFKQRRKKVGFPMDSTMELVRMKSKLAVYRTGLHRAKEKGDMDAARDWLNNMVELKKEIARLSSQ